MSAAFICVRLTSGKVRKARHSPSLAVAELHAQLSELTLIMITFMCCCLLLQVVAFILGRGALTLPLTFIQFAAVMLAPFMPAEIAADKVVNSSSATAVAQATQLDSRSAASKRRRSFEFTSAQLSAFALKGMQPAAALGSGTVLLR
jgi:hypothetical protein